MIIALYCADIDAHLDSECAFDIPGAKYEYERRQSKSLQSLWPQALYRGFHFSQANPKMKSRTKIL